MGYKRACVYCQGELIYQSLPVWPYKRACAYSTGELINQNLPYFFPSLCNVQVWEHVMRFSSQISPTLIANVKYSFLRIH